MKLELLVNDNTIEKPLQESLIYSTLQNNLNKKIKTVYMANSTHLKDASNLPDVIRVDDPKYECVLTRENLKTSTRQQQLVKVYKKTSIFSEYPQVYGKNLWGLFLLLNQACKGDNQSVLTILAKWNSICRKHPDQIGDALSKVKTDELSSKEQELIHMLLSSINKNKEIIIEPINFLAHLHRNHLKNKAQEFSLSEDNHELYVMLNRANSAYDDLLFNYMVQRNYSTIIDTEANDTYIKMAMRALDKDLYIFTTDLNEKNWKSVALNNAGKFVQSANIESYKLFLSFVNSKNKDILKKITFGQWKDLINNQPLSLSVSSYLTFKDDKLGRISMNNGKAEFQKLEFNNPKDKIDEKEILLKSISDKLDTLTQKLKDEENDTEDNADLSFWSEEDDLESQAYRNNMISELQDERNNLPES